MIFVDFPEMRLEVITALRSLSDTHHQDTQWGRVEPGVNYYDDLTLNIHILYDDCTVLPDPEASVGSIIFEREIAALRSVGDALSPTLDTSASDQTLTTRTTPDGPASSMRQLERSR